MTDVLEGEWTEPDEDRDLEVRITMKESLVRECHEDTLARLAGPDVARAAKALLEKHG